MTRKPIDIPFNPPTVDDAHPTAASLSLEVLHPPTGGYSDLLLGAARVGDAIWVVGGLGSNSVYVSREGGPFKRSRQAAKSVQGGRGLRTLQSSGRESWVSGEWGYIARSSDEGASWTRVPTNVNNACWSLAIDDHGGVWGTADNGWIGYCTDGETWEGVQRGVSCTDAETWQNEYGTPGGVAWIQASPMGVLIPAGKELLFGNEGTLEQTGLRAEHKLSHAAMSHGGTLVVVGHFGTIFRCGDGKTFEPIEAPTTYKRPAPKRGRPPMKRQTHLHRVHPFDDGRWLASGDRGLLILSNDDGRTWSKVSLAEAWGDDPPDDERTYVLGEVDGRMLIGTGNGGIVAAS